MMLERMCYLLSVGAAMPPGDALDRVTAIFVAAFAGWRKSPPDRPGRSRPAGGAPVA